MAEAKNGRPAAERQTLIEEGTEFKGTLSSNCPIVIKGRLEGQVSGPSLHVSASGSISGTVEVGTIDSEGELAGQYTAQVVRLSGRVKDKTVIRAQSLEIKLAGAKGALEVTFGECDLEVGDVDADERAAVAPPPDPVRRGADSPPRPAAKPQAEAASADRGVVRPVASPEPSQSVTEIERALGNIAARADERH
jgi:cytoskeletal protein CcmA (bactofilin family)